MPDSSTSHVRSVVVHDEVRQPVGVITGLNEPQPERHQVPIEPSYAAVLDGFEHSSLDTPNVEEQERPGLLLDTSHHIAANIGSGDLLVRLLLLLEVQLPQVRRDVQAGSALARLGKGAEQRRIGHIAGVVEAPEDLPGAAVLVPTGLASASQLHPNVGLTTIETFHLRQVFPQVIGGPHPFEGHPVLRTRAAVPLDLDLLLPAVHQVAVQPFLVISRELPIEAQQRMHVRMEPTTAVRHLDSSDLAEVAKLTSEPQVRHQLLGRFLLGVAVPLAHREQVAPPVSDRRPHRSQLVVEVVGDCGRHKDHRAPIGEDTLGDGTNFLGSLSSNYRGADRADPRIAADHEPVEMRLAGLAEHDVDRTSVRQRLESARSRAESFQDTPRRILELSAIGPPSTPFGLLFRRGFGVGCWLPGIGFPCVTKPGGWLGGREMSSGWLRLPGLSTNGPGSRFASPGRCAPLVPIPATSASRRAGGISSR